MMNNEAIYQNFSYPLLAWFDHHGRKNLPWQYPKSAYRVWVSEIMLQQTQVQTVIPYFERFMTSFPTVKHLACADEDTLLSHWSGLGYYSRARNMHKAAKIITSDFNGQFPADLNQLMQLPGIGPSTAAAIASLAFNQPTAILDGNVKRVLTRYFMIDGWPEQAQIKNQLWQLANQCMPSKRCADYTQAIMDLGATCCTVKRPACSHCPVQETCLAYLNKKVAHYPFRKVKKVLPTKTQHFLLLHTDDNKIYLEKRPPTGLWGGLWCLPTLDIEEEPIDYLAQWYDITLMQAKPLPNFKHTFSHFHLYINPTAFKIEHKSCYVAEGAGKWFAPQELTSIGLAKPIYQIISNFLELT
ncbi:A/G-specific adenine glycosylase [Legionella beliardensis]|uniref:Adenine DNA glycosylase n=1 Tax=Legionella beliardensis TaxID=91822 RepID=A0A378I189_9GAMM|nr:A/G-specific adenine glycosylase [Legionella beliardensis]STX28722.1 A/G-specific adenine glycosylase [Legionella beliardensis]